MCCGITNHIGCQKINYYNKFIEKFSELATPLNELRKKNVNFEWTKKQENSFIKLKDAIIKSTKLVHFEDKLPIVLAVDASNKGIDAVAAIDK